MKSLFLLIFTFFSFTSSKTIQYVSPDGNYVMDVDESVRVARKILDNGYIDKFTYYETGATKSSYVVTVLKLNIGDVPDEADDKIFEAYKLGFINTCSCELLEAKRITYNKLKGVEFKSKSSNGNYSYSFNVVRKSYSYSITFSASYENFTKYTSVYTNIVNSMELYK